MAKSKKKASKKKSAKKKVAKKKASKKKSAKKKVTKKKASKKKSAKKKVAKKKASKKKSAKKKTSQRSAPRKKRAKKRDWDELVVPATEAAGIMLIGALKGSLAAAEIFGVTLSKPAKRTSDGIIRAGSNALKQYVDELENAAARAGDVFDP